MRKAMVDAVEDRLLKVFMDRGFTRHPLPPEEAASELRTAFPLGRLKRGRDGGLEVVEIQFDKHRRPRFVINFGIVPEDGVTLPWGHHLTRDEADVSALSEAYRLYSSSLRARWFGPGLLSARDDRAISGLVARAAGLSAEIETWFESGTVGRHMRGFGLNPDA